MQLRQLGLLGGTVGQHDTTLLIRNLPAILNQGPIGKERYPIDFESLIRLGE